MSFADDNQAGERNMEENGTKKHMGTFIVEVCCRENASWQGIAAWIEGDRRFTFSSTLELFRAIDQSVSAQ